MSDSDNDNDNDNDNESVESQEDDAAGDDDNDTEDVQALMDEANAPLPNIPSSVASRSFAPRRPRYSLHDAAEAGDADLVSVILAPVSSTGGASADADFMPGIDVDVNERDKDGLTPLLVALLNGRLAVATHLIKNGASLTSRIEGSAPLHVSISMGSYEVHRTFADQAVELLLANDINPNTTDFLGSTPLHLAATFDLPTCVRLLTSSPSCNTINSKDNQGDTPLHMAAWRGSTSAMAALLDAGADTSIINRLGRTALHTAAYYGHKDCTALLRKRGASIGVKDARGFLPAHCAAAMAHHSIATSLGVDDFKGIPSGMSGPHAEVEKKKEARTVIIGHPLCMEHRTCLPLKRTSSEPPPENVRRLQVLIDPTYGILRTKEFADVEWDSAARPAAITDVLRVHEYQYMKKIRDFCNSIPEGTIRELDNDTAVSHESFEASLVAAGAVCDGVDRLVSGRNDNVFCAVRPPGHHAGPTGIVTSDHDRHGSHGFCLLNNVAIGAAYALHVHRDVFKRVAIVDFDVHHGNGTEEIINNLEPRFQTHNTVTPYVEASFKTLSYKPWLGENDKSNVFFASVHGYGPRSSPDVHEYAEDWFYPGSGMTNIDGVTGRHHGRSAGKSVPAHNHSIDLSSPTTASTSTSSTSTTATNGSTSSESKDGKVGAVAGDEVLIDVGLAMKQHVRIWRQSWRDAIIPRLVKFNPDLIIISAGFDAHRRDTINMGYLGLDEHDYYWITHHLMTVANKCCNGRLISVLEGGYKVQGRVVSPFARSVAGMVRAQREQTGKVWDNSEAEWEKEKERIEEEAERVERERLEQEAAIARQRREALRREAIARAMESSLSSLVSPVPSLSSLPVPEGVSVTVMSSSTTSSVPSTSVTVVASSSPTMSSTISSSSSVANSSASTTSTTSSSNSTTGGEEQSSEATGARSKRRRGAPVDYVALNAKMDEELKAKDGASSSSSSSSSSSDTKRARTNPTN